MVDAYDFLPVDIFPVSLRFSRGTLIIAHIFCPTTTLARGVDAKGAETVGAVFSDMMKCC